MVTELFHADGRTDMVKLTVAVGSVGNAPNDKNCFFSFVLLKLAASSLTL